MMKKIISLITVFIFFFIYTFSVKGQYESERQDIYDYKKFFDDLTRDELLEISTELTVTPDVVFAIGDLQVPVYDEALANALEQLSQHKREIILLYYFLEKTEAEIGRLYNCAQQTINYQKKTILKQLKYYLELEELL